MAPITLFSAPKPFTDPHIGTIQHNAIKSWTLLPDADVILLGDEDGLAKVAQELGVKHLPDVDRNASGTPLISSMFQLAREHSDNGLLCIINTDMILMPDFFEAAQQALRLKKKFVLLSQRWDLDVTESLKFSKGWEAGLRSSVHELGELHRPSGSDFFLFPNTCYIDLPPFAIGRGGWDNWMIYKAHQEKWPVIDCTSSVMIVHQNHDYHHLRGGISHHNHPETDENTLLAGGSAAVRYTILDATTRLVNGRLITPAFSWGRFWRGVELILRNVFSFLPENKLEIVVRPKGWLKRFKKIFGNQ